MFTQKELRILSEAMTLKIRDFKSQGVGHDYLNKLQELNALAEKVVSLQEYDEELDG